MSESMLELTIVLAVQRGVERLTDVLSALGQQVTPEVEVLVCYAGEETRVPDLVVERPGLRLLAGDTGALIPHLWRDGIHAAGGKRVALSVVHCRPGPDWVRGLLDADLSQRSAV